MHGLPIAETGRTIECWSFIPRLSLPMCGIAGVFHADASLPIDAELPRRMAGRIAHRGPDGVGFWNGRGVAFAHRRLSIVDVEGGRQPMSNEDGRVQVVFNGEIYNHLELRAWLESRGHRFANRSDTEVLVHLYEEFGQELVHKLRGMFAFAIWDDRRDQLFLARDRLGLKPLYLARTADRLLFASEPKAILADLTISRQVDPRSLEDYLCFGMVVSPRSIFAGIEQLAPGHTLLVGRDSIHASSRCYWTPTYKTENRRIEDWRDALHAKLEEVVRLHLMSDVPLGAFLSGGVDSGTLLALMRRFSSNSIRTFTIGFLERDFSELPQARATAAMHGTIHTEQVISPNQTSLLEEMTEYFDEPLADTSKVPTFLVAKLAASSVKVALSGDGADEAFAGYPRYQHDLREDQLRRRLPEWFRRTALREASKLWPRGRWLPRPFRLAQVMENISHDAATATAISMAYCRLPWRRRLLHRDVVAELGRHDPKDAIRHAFRQAPAGDIVAGMTAADFGVLLPDDYLVKVDRAGMAHGLEVRPPFLDHEFIELACTIPSELKIRDGVGKWILKQSITDLVPEENIRLPKRGFNVPVNRWLSGPLRQHFEDMVLDQRGPLAPFLNLGMAEKMFYKHVTGQVRNGQVLWSLLVLSHWANRYLREQPEPSPESRPAVIPAPPLARRSPPMPIRVAFVVHVMQVAGAEVLIEEIIRRLGPAIEPTILCLDSVGAIGERLRAQGVPVVVLGRHSGRDFGVARRMAREIRARRIQIVHAHQYTPFFYAAIAKLWCWGGFRLIQTEHGRHYPDIVSPTRRGVNRLILDRLADAVNACCEFSAKALSRNDGFAGQRIEVIDNGVELSRYHSDEDERCVRDRLGLDRDKKYIACVARFHPVKDHAMLLRAFARLAMQRSDCELLLAGDGPLRLDLERQVRESGVQNRVQFLGVRRDVPDLLRAANVFTLTSVSEAASLTVMEAMACARPCVVTNVGGNPELIRDGKEGFLVPRGDDAACAEALAKVLDNPDLARSLGASGRRRAEERFSLSRTVERYYGLYRELVRI
jgi:asparagine synthase (glutamine-hydrolysing)